MIDVPDMTEAELDELDRHLADTDEIRDAVRKIEVRQKRDAEFLVLLNLGLADRTPVGGFARAAAVDAARAINGEAS